MNEDLDKGIQFHREGKLDRAEKIYLAQLKINKKDASLLQLIGTIYLQKKNHSLAEKYFLDSLALQPDNPGTLNNLGILKKNMNDIDKSLEYFEKNISKNNFLGSWINKSNILIENNKNLEGLKFSVEALKKYPTDKKLKNNSATFLFKCGFQEESLKIYKEFDNNNSHFKDSYINYTNILILINELSRALEVINKFILEDNNNLEALRQRALIHKLLLNYNKSEEDLLNSIKIDKLNIISNQMIVKLYIDIKKYEEAIKYCDLMLSKEKDVNFFLTKKILCKINLGSWTGLEEDLKIFNKNLKYTQSSINPLSLKYINDDPLFQKNFTEKYWLEKPKNNYLSVISSEYKRKVGKAKIRIGYFSGDFKKHAVFHLIQDLFINHNKSDFEIYAYSTVKSEGPERDKIANNSDKFFDIDNFSDEEIIRLIKSHELDVAIDLSGYTVHNKSHLFEHNIAEIKINYLGFPGTMGTDKYDYILADKNIIPINHQNFYSEKVIYMSEIYQPFTPVEFNMNRKRSEFNLPENVFIMGCFSRIEKILPKIFDVWMKIINKYDNVNLALCINKENVKKNIQDYCNQKNYNYKKILFLNSMEHKENLMRISTFDLYLDTFPYNGHTGISDSLFQSCVPTISFTGNSFASRVSYSLLKSLDHDQLVTFNEKDYFDKIVYFYKNRDELNLIKDSLIKFKNKNRNRMVKFTLDFENIIKLTLLKHQKNKHS